MNQFYVGQEVQCIDAKFERVTIDQQLRQDAVYKIRWLGMHRSYVDGDFLGIKVEEIERGVCPTYGDEDPPFRATRFRPLVTDPLAEFRQIAADPDGYKPPAEEGPRRKRKLPVREREEV